MTATTTNSSMSVKRPAWRRGNGACETHENERGMFAYLKSVGQHPLPPERGVGVAHVGLDVIVAQHAVRPGKLVRGQGAAQDLAGGIPGNVAADAWKDAVERGGQSAERLVLLGG